MEAVTIQDVASHANVAASTVSKVLNDYKGVSSAARERVLSAVQALNYQPNRAARSFRMGKTQTASIFLPLIGTEFFDRLITAIDHELAAHGYDAALFPLLNAQRLERYKQATALPYQADGVIMASLNPDWLFPNAALPVKLPAVLVDAYHASYDTVTVANAKGAYAATTHLLEGSGTPFMVTLETGDTTFASGVFMERLKGFERALSERGVLEAHTVLTTTFSSEGGREALRRILARTEPPVSVFASCDLLAKGVLEEARHQTLQPGKDVHVVGFDDQPWAEAYGLSTVKQPIEALGKEAVTLFLNRLENPDKETVHREFEPELVVRTTS